MKSLKTSLGPNAAFFAGLLVGLCLLSFAGSYIHRHEAGFENYIRLTKFIDDTTLFQPTSQQLYATVKSGLPANVKNIVVWSDPCFEHSRCGTGRGG